MFQALSWLAVFVLVALWSLAAWALHAVGVWIVSNAGTLSGAASGVGGITFPDWLAPWVPAAVVQVMTQIAAGLGPVVDSLLQAAPALAGGLTVAVWAMWGIGSVLLLLLGAGLHLLITVWRRRRGSGGSATGRGPSLAAG